MTAQFESTEQFRAVIDRAMTLMSEDPVMGPVSYTHLTLPTNREV